MFLFYSLLNISELFCSDSLIGTLTYFSMKESENVIISILGMLTLEETGVM